MKKMDKIILLFILSFCISYLYLSYFYELLPFELYLSFKPNTMPLGLGVLGILFCLILLFSPTNKQDDTTQEYAKFEWVSACAVVALMVAYALLLKPLGFILSTFLFLTLSSFILGERNFKILFLVVAIGTGGIWYLVSETLGIYMAVLPEF